MSKIFFDIGANTGTTFDWLATQPHDYRDHTFYLFEPSPRHFAALLSRCEVKAKLGYSIRVCPFGLAGSTGIFPLWEKDDPQGDSFYGWTASDHTPKNISTGYDVVAAGVALAEAIRVITSPQDSVVLDIDAEGAEYDMLWDLARSRVLKRVTRIMVEFHHIPGRNPSERKKELVDWYAKHGHPLEVRGFVP